MSMKKFFLMCCMALMSTSLFAQVGTSYVGVNANYCLKSSYKPFGIGVKFQHEFMTNVRGEASFNYFFKKEHATLFDVNINGHYLLHVTDGFTIYPLAGVGYVNQKIEGFDSDGKFCGNLGAGVEFPIGACKINAEFKYQLGDDWDCPYISAGVAFPI